MDNSKKNKRILLVGNPNVGKSTIFNILCYKNQKTGNYAGVTVASHQGEYTYRGETVEIIDLPGSYSIYPSSEDESIFAEYLLNENHNYEAVLYIADALNLKRSLLLFEQIQDLGIPLVLVINQIDQANLRGYQIDLKLLQETYNIPVFASNAKKQEGIEELREVIANSIYRKATKQYFEIPSEHKGTVYNISSQTKENNPYKVWTLLASYQSGGKHQFLNQKIIDLQKDQCMVPKRLQVQETLRRYEHIDGILSKIRSKKIQAKDLITEKLDRILVHKFWGYIIFFLVLLFTFTSVFFLAEYPMTWIENLFDFLSNYTATHIPAGPLNSLLSEGIIPGIGGIVVFAPQIGILLYFLYLLEDSGYMARVIFLMDRFLRPFGLNGKSIVPLISGTACAIPAIMSTRNIENVKERMITILVTPFMTCSARLPVYSIIISLIVSDHQSNALLKKSLLLMAMYFLGAGMALLASLVLKFSIKTKMKTFLIMDLPTYKTPLWGYNLKQTLVKVWEFITGAGKVIFAVSIIIWVLSYFGPKNDFSFHSHQSNVDLKNSYLATIGRKVEPVIKPLGFDWKLGVGILTSFAAREVFVGTMSTLYSLNDPDNNDKLRDKMQKDTYPNGEKVFSLATDLSLLVYYAFAMQCISTIAVVYRETRSLKWTLIQLFSMSGIAFLSSFLIYQLFK